MSDAIAQGNLDMWIAKNNGLDNEVQRTPQSSSPTSFREWAQEMFKSRVAA